MNLNSILSDNKIQNSLPEPLKDDEVPSTVHSLANTIWSKIFNHSGTVNNINILDKLFYETGINACRWKNSNFVNQYLGHILTGNLRIIENDKLRKLISKGPNYKESKTINKNRQFT